MPQVVSANRLTDGLVVFWTEDEKWSERLAEAKLWPDADSIKQAIEVAQKTVARCEVVDVYAFDAIRVDGRIEATHLRERIRTMGPTVHPDHGKQAQPR